MDWYVYLAQLGIIATAVPCIGVFSYHFGKAIIDRWFKAREQSYQYELDRLSKRDEIQYSKLHEMRAKIMADAYTRFVRLHHDGMTHLSNGTQLDKAKVGTLIEDIKSTLTQVLENSIYFEEDLSELLIQFLTKYHKLAQDRLTDLESLESKDVLEKWLPHWLNLSKDIPDILSAIGDEFRTMLGVRVRPTIERDRIRAMKKICLPVILALAVSVLPVSAEDWTVAGKDYHNVTVGQVEVDRVHITYDGGVGTVMLADLTPELQKRFNYDPAAAAKAAAKQQAKAAASDALVAQVTAQKKAANGKSEAANSEARKSLEDQIQLHEKNMADNEERYRAAPAAYQSAFAANYARGEADEQKKIDELKAQLAAMP